MQRGIRQIVAAVRPTLGPLHRHSVFESFGKMELLDDGGTIARRIIQLPNRDQDMGAMFIRQMLWQLREKTGDGTATAAVIFETIFNEGLRFIVAGGNAIRLRHYLDEGLKLIDHELAGMAQPVEGEENLAQVAQSVCYDPEMAAILGEILDIVGEHGQVDIRSGHGRGFEHNYVEGMYWKGGVLSRAMISDRERFIVEMQDAAILISDADVKEAGDLARVMALAVHHEIKNLMLILGSIDNSVVGLLLSERIREKINVAAVKIDGIDKTDLAAAQQDLAVLTGGQPVVKAAGQTLAHVQPAHFGHARWVWADKRNFGLSAGRGDPRTLRQHVAALRQGYRHTVDQERADKLRSRIGKLLGGSATLHVGGITKSELELRKEVAERTVRALRGALTEGVVPGGGVALYNCKPALEKRLKASQSIEERAAYKILLKAIEAPMRTLLTNAGYEASEIMAKVQREGPGHGFDTLNGCLVDMAQAGIFDVANVQREAAHSAIASAGLALTVDVMVQRRQPEQSTTP
jgi:chaperonin GroEL